MATRGFAYGDVRPSPVGMAELDQLLSTVLWSADDTAALRMAGRVMDGQVDEIVDLWWAFVGSHPQLVRAFGAERWRATDGLESVRDGVGEWIRALCTCEWDQEWLDYQHEIVRRHVDHDTPDAPWGLHHVPLRYLIALVVPITTTVAGVLEASGAERGDIAAMRTAWFKAVTLTVALWAQPHDASRW